MARPSSYQKSGGGRLNGVDVEIVDYEFTIGETFEIKKGKNKGKPFTALDLSVSFQQDGVEDLVIEKLLVANCNTIPAMVDAGDDADFSTLISEDGKTLNMNWWENCNPAIFITSLCHPEDGEPGFPEELFDEDPDSVNLEPIIGVRCHVVKVKNGRKETGSNGKEYDSKDLKVGKFYSLPGGKKAAATKPTAGKPVAGKPAAAKVTGPTAADVDTAAAEAIGRYASKEPGKSILASKLRMKAITDPLFKKDAKLRDLVIEQVFEDEERLAALDGVVYDKKKKSLKNAA